MASADRGRAFERRIRRSMARLLARRLPSPAAAEDPRDASRLLVLRHDAIGDMIMTTGVLRALAAARPDVRIDVVASPSNASMLDGIPWVSTVHVFDRRSRADWGAIRTPLRIGDYDAVIDGIALTPRVATATAWLLAASRARWRAGVGGREHDELYSLRIPRLEGGSHVEQLAALAAPFGLDPRGSALEPELVVRAHERVAADARWGAVRATGLRVAVNIDSNDARRCWPPDDAAAAMRHLLARVPDARVLVMGMPARRAALEALARDGSAAGAVTPPLREALALVATADLVLTPDTSIAHMAPAVGTPAVTLMLRRAAPFAPPLGRGRIVWAESDSVATISRGAVAAAIDEVLAALGATG